MKTAMKWMLLTLAALAIFLASALPFAIPPLVKRIAEDKLIEFGYPSRVSMRLGYCWNGGPELAGSLKVAVLGSPWAVLADFGAGLGSWHAKLEMPETRFSESDPVIAKLLAEHPLSAVSNLTFSGSVDLNASAERTWSLPVPVWSAKLKLRDVSADLVAGEKPVSVRGLSVSPGASGIARHLDVAPMFLRIPSLSGGGFTLTNLFASVRATEKALMVSEASAGFCGGKINLYSLFLDPQTLNAGLTLFLDDVDAGEALTHVNGFHGEASGRLHGKIRLFVREGGKRLRLSDAFLYSTPGETGKLRMTNPDVLTDNLALAGLNEATRSNVANALNDLDYTVLKLDLKRVGKDDATLSVRIDGTATRGDLTVPVNLVVNISGKLEQLINTGLGMSDRLKGKRK